MLARHSEQKLLVSDFLKSSAVNPLWAALSSVAAPRPTKNFSRIVGLPSDGINTCGFHLILHGKAIKEGKVYDPRAPSSSQAVADERVRCSQLLRDAAARGNPFFAGTPAAAAFLQASLKSCLPSGQAKYGVLNAAFTDQAWRGPHAILGC
jgi:hypothetical protein